MVVVLSVDVGCRLLVKAVGVSCVAFGRSRMWFDSGGEEPVVYAPCGSVFVAGVSCCISVLRVGACIVPRVSLPFVSTQGTLTALGAGSSGLCGECGGALLCMVGVAGARVVDVVV